MTELLWFENVAQFEQDYMRMAVPNKPQKKFIKGKGKGRPVTSHASAEGK